MPGAPTLSGSTNWGARRTQGAPKRRPWAMGCNAFSVKAKTVLRPAWLANAHRKLDKAVFAAYGWPADLSDDELLAKLLALNLERVAKEGELTLCD